MIAAKLLPTLLLVVLTASAFAAGTATVSSGGEQSARFSWLDPQTIRIDAPGQEGYMVLRDNDLYSVIEEDGQTLVFEMSAMMQAVAPMADAAPGSTTSTPSN